MKVIGSCLAGVAAASVFLSLHCAAFDYAYPPLPMQDPVACGAVAGQEHADASIVCDPDGLMTGSDREAAIEAARILWQDVENSCSAEDRKPKQQRWSFSSMFGVGQGQRTEATRGHELALYVLNKLPPGYSAESLARQVHDSWGLGAPACGNGVLIVMSRMDREAYWSTGDAAGKVMSQSRIDAALAKMRPLLRDNEFSQGAAMAVFETAATFACDVAAGGNSNRWPRSLGAYSPGECQRRLPAVGPLDGEGGWLAFAIFVTVTVVIVSLVCWAIQDDMRRKREEQEQEQEAREVLRRLDDVLENPPPRPAGGDGDADGAGPDDVRLAAEQVAGPRGGVCAICLEEGLKDAEGEHEPMVLPCGHVFHKDCIAVWSREQSEQHREKRCPICRAEYDDGEEAAGGGEEEGAGDGEEDPRGVEGDDVPRQRGGMGDGGGAAAQDARRRRAAGRRAWRRWGQGGRRWGQGGSGSFIRNTGSRTFGFEQTYPMYDNGWTAFALGRASRRFPRVIPAARAGQWADRYSAARQGGGDARRGAGSLSSQFSTFRQEVQAERAARRAAQQRSSSRGHTGGSFSGGRSSGGGGGRW